MKGALYAAPIIVRAKELSTRAPADSVCLAQVVSSSHGLEGHTLHAYIPIPHIGKKPTGQPHPGWPGPIDGAQSSPCVSWDMG